MSNLQHEWLHALQKNRRPRRDRLFEQFDSQRALGRPFPRYPTEDEVPDVVTLRLDERDSVSDISIDHDLQHEDEIDFADWSSTEAQEIVKHNPEQEEATPVTAKSNVSDEDDLEDYGNVWGIESVPLDDLVIRAWPSDESPRKPPPQLRCRSLPYLPY